MWLKALFFLIVLLCTGCDLSEPYPLFQVYYEQIPSSNSAWGRSQSRIVRDGNTVYTTFMDNRHHQDTIWDKAIVQKKSGDLSWQSGAEFVTSSTVNMLIDSDGILHLFVFVPKFDEVNTSHIGGLKHCWTTTVGDIEHFNEEWIVDVNDVDYDNQLVNKRLIAAIDGKDRMVVAWGRQLSEKNQICVYSKEKGKEWTYTPVATDLQYFMVHPLVIAAYTGEIYMIAEQFQPTHSLMFFEYDGTQWKPPKMIIDLNNDPEASTEEGSRSLVENEDMLLDRSGTLHHLYREKYVYYHSIRQGDSWSKQIIDFGDVDISYIKIIEVNGEFFYLVASNGKLYVKNANGGSIHETDMPEGMRQPFLYLSVPRTGTSLYEKYMDVFFPEHEISSDYPTLNGYYLRFEKTALQNL